MESLKLNASELHSVHEVIYQVSVNQHYLLIMNDANFIQLLNFTLPKFKEVLLDMFFHLV